MEQKEQNLNLMFLRRRRPEKRKILPDPLFNSLSIAKFINYILTMGKKGVSEKIFYGAMDIIKSKNKKDGIDIFDIAIKNASRF